MFCTGRLIREVGPRLPVSYVRSSGTNMQYDHCSESCHTVNSDVVMLCQIQCMLASPSS